MPKEEDIEYISLEALKLAMDEHNFVPIMRDTFIKSFKYYLTKMLEEKRKRYA